MKVRVFFILVFAGLYCFTYSQYQEKEIRKGLRLISERNINRMVKYFSSYKCYGRQSGSEGYDRASEYVKNKFIKWGLKP